MKSTGILFTASTYKSVDSAIRFLRSIQNVEGSHKAVICGPVRWELEHIKAHVGEVPNCKIRLFHSGLNNMYLCRAFGFVLFAANKKRARYYFSGDDDIEFTEASRDLVKVLDSERRFSVATFSNGIIGYKVDDSGKTWNPYWINGDSMFSHWDDNLLYGLPDSVRHAPVSYYTEIEYEHRMRHLTHKSTLVFNDRQYYTHHFRETPYQNEARGDGANQAMTCGRHLWEEKYDLPPFSEYEDGIWDRLDRDIKFMPEKMVQHVMFGGQSNDWQAIYESLKDNFVEV